MSSAGPGRAQATGTNPNLPRRGTREVELRARYPFRPGDTASLYLSYGPFLDNGRLQVGLAADYRRFDGTDSITYGLLANYHFPGRSSLLPFVGAFYGMSSGEGDSFTLRGVQGGAKYFLNRSVAATASLVYRDWNSQAVNNQLALQFGLAVYLR